VTVTDVVLRDPACRGGDVPSSLGRYRSNITDTNKNKLKD
jgi:hypothetical protein